MARILLTLLAGARVVRRLSEVAATLGFGALAGLLAYTVWQRYVMGTPSSWSDEFAMILFLWLIFGAAALVVPYRDQIAVGLLVDTVPAPWRRWLEVLGAALAGAILLATLPVTMDYIAFLWRERTPALRWRLNHVYLIFALFQGLIALGLLLRALIGLIGRATPFDDPAPANIEDWIE
ncbi:MAG: TRAP transporter small permease subunit [Rhodobacter sp.]|uniref:TRAP transporter small permease n=1 Tax=Pararhodobacter sp. TaxID=2127056 RepID=UPI001DAB20CE|nr:TRAP transporter small permease subunit [Pararhodobacter sp.]MCB1344320.1 TRAP transporter small permease subunit [Paracoccaceae bacterium]MCC0073353.1 TRAP transporter small permease subunit [Rhodobacter sp.]HPD91187.1 TRAP transporter small permease subunit [Pararhodobacter sp.]